MQEPQGRIEDEENITPMRVKPGALAEAQLLQLDIPVAELAPEKLPHGLADFVIAILIDGAVNGFGCRIQPATNPAILQRLRRAGVTY